MWNIGPNYDNDEYFDGYRENPRVTELEEKIELAGTHLKKILTMLYSDTILDNLALENELDELAHQLDIKLIAGDLQICRKKKCFPIIDPIEYKKIFEDIP